MAVIRAEAFVVVGLAWSIILPSSGERATAFSSPPDGDRNFCNLFIYVNCNFPPGDKNKEVIKEQSENPKENDCFRATSKFSTLMGCIFLKF